MQASILSLTLRRFFTLALVIGCTISLTVVTLPLYGASSANSAPPVPTWLFVRVVGSIFMAFGTMSLVDIVVAPGQIFSPAHWLKMRWVHAKRIATKMIQVHPIWNVSNQQKVSQSVDKQFCAFMSSRSTADANLPVTYRTNGTAPDPTAIRGRLIHTRPKPFFEWLWWWAFGPQQVLNVSQAIHA